MHYISLVLVCLVTVSDGRRVQGFHNSKHAKHLQHPYLNWEGRTEASSEFHPLTAFKNLLLVSRPKAAFHSSRVDTTGIHRGLTPSAASAGNGHGRIRMPSMSDVVEAFPLAPPKTRNSLVTALDKDGFFSAKAVDTTDLVKEARQLQGLSPLACAALGRAMTCCLLLAEPIEKKETFQVIFQGDGPIRGIMASSNGALETRGRVGNPQLESVFKSEGKFDVGWAVGQGTLHVTRTKNLPGAPVETPYTSSVPIQSGEVPDDINFFLHESEQRTSAIAAGVYCEPTNSTEDGFAVTHAGGWYVDVLPDCPAEKLQELEQNLQFFYSTPTTRMLRDGMKPEDMLKLMLKGMEPQIVRRREPVGLEKSCKCNEGRFMKSITMLPQEEIDTILKKGEDVDGKCDFCGKKFIFSTDTIRQILEKDEKEKADAENVAVEKDGAENDGVIDTTADDEADAAEKDADDKGS